MPNFAAFGATRVRIPLARSAVAMRVEEGRITDVRIALGGVAHKPWRAWTAEAALKGGPATPERFRAAAEAELPAGLVPVPA